MRPPVATAMIAVLLALVILLGPPAAPPGGVLAATGPEEVLADPVLEERARGLTKHLRCLVCQNQSIDDSDAQLARDLRRLVRERLEAGDSDDEVIAFMTARYGEFVLLKPPMRPGTYLLWFGPPAVLLVAGAATALYLRRRRAAGNGAAGEGEPEPLSAEERARLDALLATAGGGPEDAERRQRA